MLSEELNSMIDAAIADGVITDKERQLIMKRAVKEGQDPDEVEMIMEGKLQAQKKVYKPQNSKLGTVKKCPSCGAIIPESSLKCPECSYTFRDVKANSTYKELYDNLVEADRSRKHIDITDYAGLLAFEKDHSRVIDRKVSLIINCPIPNTEDDLVEFLTMASPNLKMTKGLITMPGIIRGLGFFAISCLVFVIICVLISIFKGDDSIGPAFGAGLMLGGIVGFFGGSFYAESTTKKHDEVINKNKIASAWKIKCEQCMLKAKILVKDPQELERLQSLISK